MTVLLATGALEAPRPPMPYAGTTVLRGEQCPSKGTLYGLRKALETGGDPR